MASFEDLKTAARMREVMARVIQSELQRTRPPANNAVVTKINRRFNKCTVAFPGDLGEVEIPLGGVVPSSVGQVVRVDGVLGDRYISDVMGPPADAWPGTVRYTMSPDLMPGYLSANGLSYYMSDYPDLAWALGQKDRLTEQVLGLPGLYAYYRFDGVTPSSGVDIIDDSGNGRSLTLGYTSTSPDFVSQSLLAERGWALSMDGTHHAYRNTGTIDWTTNGCTLACWVNLDSTSEAGYFLQVGSYAGTGHGFGIGVGSTTSLGSNGNRLLADNFAGEVINDTLISIGTGWHHVAAEYYPSLTLDNNVAAPYVFVYLDGVLSGYETTSTISSNSSSYIVAGARRTSGSSFDRKVDAMLDEAIICLQPIGPWRMRQLYERSLAKFAVPDLRNRVLVGMDTLGGLDAGLQTLGRDELGWTGGEEKDTLSEAQMPAHAHTFTVWQGFTRGISDGYSPDDQNTGNASKTVTTSTKGSSLAHNNMQPHIRANAQIKT